MDCATARRVLREAGAPTEPTVALVEAQQHRRACPSCEAWEEAGSEWRAALSEKLPPLRVPLGAKERLFAALGRARAGNDRRRPHGRLASALVLVTFLGTMAAGLWWWREATGNGILVAALTEDHLLYAAHLSPAEFLSSDPDAVARWFAGRVDFAVAAPRIPGAELIGGRLCTLADRRAALSFYEHGGRRVSLYQVHAEGLPLAALRPMTVEGRRYLCAHRKGVSVLAWTDRDVLYALVSDLPENDMLRLARF